MKSTYKTERTHHLYDQFGRKSPIKGGFQTPSTPIVMTLVDLRSDIKDNHPL